MSEIPKGSKVRVTFEGEYGMHCADPDCRGRTVDGYGVPLNSSVESLSPPPLPEEPPVGAYVEVRNRDLLAEPEIYVRRASYAHDEPPWDGWFSLRFMGAAPTAWVYLHEDGAKVTRLYREGEQPQEKYERAAESGWLKWMHSCGGVAGLRADIDPNASPYSERWCITPSCTQIGPYTPLYRKVSSDA